VIIEGKVAEWAVVPRVGIGPVRLGMTRDELHRAIGEPSTAYPRRKVAAGIWSNPTDYFFRSVVEVSYADGLVDFVGVSGGAVQVTFRGVSLFEVLFRDLAQWLAVQTEVDCADREFPASWGLPNLWLCLWRAADETAIGKRSRASGDPAGLFVQQIAVDKRFGRATMVAKLEGEPVPPSPMELQLDDEKAVRQIWREIARREAAGDRWLGIVEQLRARCQESR
jgi:hypothetical protein